MATLLGVTDAPGESVTRTWTLTKAVNALEIALDTLPADDMPIKRIVSAQDDQPQAGA